VQLKVTTGRYFLKTVVFLESGNDITTKLQIYDDATHVTNDLEDAETETLN
jgi:predicted transcriptional regulator